MIMLVKCAFLHKFHACLAQERRLSTRAQVLDQVAEAIYVCIPEDVKLRDLFLSWSQLSRDEKNSIDNNIPVQRFDLYIALKKALGHYEDVQETSGAPGVESGVFGLTCDLHVKEQLTWLIERVDYLTKIINVEVMPAEEWD